MTPFYRSCLLAAALLSTGAAGETAAPPPDPRNVILIIGDGMDEHQVTIARNYLHGAAGELVLDGMPVRGAAQILTVEDAVEGAPVYVSDSANTATSMASGEVTSRGRIGTRPGSDEAIPNIVELAARGGVRTGIVTTASVTDATPAAFYAHINFRLCENPDTMVEVSFGDIPLGDCSAHLKAAGGAGSIAEQLAASSLHVALGGGTKHFEPNAEGTDAPVADLAQRNGFQLVTDRDALSAAPTGAPLLGLFAPSTLPVRLRGEDGREAESPEPSLLNRVHPYLGSVRQPEPMRCEPNPDFAGIPELRAMTETALRHLDAGNERGFFLMVESASVDKQAHERKPCGSIGEMEQLDEALGVALAYAEEHPGTLILVTADHSQAAQLIPEQSLFAAYPIPLFSPGKVARIVTPEGAIMAVNYATTNLMMEEHTGAAVPLYANEPGRGLVPPYLRQPELFDIMRNYLGL